MSATNDQCLTALYAMQQWAHAHGAARPADFITRNAHTYRTGIRRENRLVSFRLHDHGRNHGCLACGGAIPAGSAGDHLIPTAEGGPDGAQNYIPLCGRCNSSKGVKDLFDWWIGHLGKSLGDLGAALRDVLCAYARLTWAHHDSRGTLDDPAGDHLRSAVRELADSLPSDQHRKALLVAAGVLAK
jgi:hypothetical protein